MDSARTKSASEGVAPVGINSISENDLLSNQPEPRYECPICLNWLTEPVITTCGHRFCKKCITSWLQTSGHCPIDNINLTMKVDIFPDNYTRREIQEQRMACPFSAKGCTVKVAPLDMDQHIATCEHNQPEPSTCTDTRVPCSFHTLGCKENFESQEELARHLQHDVQKHMSSLLNAYSEMRLHNDMSNSSMDAKEQEAMCLWDPADKHNPSGESQSQPPVPNNMNALIRALYERVVILEQRNREQDIVIANISKQLSAFVVSKRMQTNDISLRYCMGNFIWKVDNFKGRLDAMLRDNSKMLYSPGFYTSPNGYRFCIRLNISLQNPHCFALNFHIMSSEHDDCLDWPFNGRFSISMVNQYYPEQTQKDTIMSNSTLTAFRKPTGEFNSRGFGYSEYAVVSDVVRNGFVRNDTLVIKVHVKCV